MPSPELRESYETEPAETPDIRTAWANWTEAGDIPTPNPVENHESRTVQDIQDGWPDDSTADTTATADDQPSEGIIYDHEADELTERRQQASLLGETAVQAELTEDQQGDQAEQDAAREAQLAEARQAVETAYAEPAAEIPKQDLARLPLDDHDIAARTTDNRVNLADDVPAVDLKPTYDGYLDVVMHGDADGTEAHVHGEITEFSLEDTAELVEQTPGWERRPVRLLSCSTGQDSYAQELANRLDVPVYAPSDVLAVKPDGSTEIRNGGAWRRFEPELQ